MKKKAAAFAALMVALVLLFGMTVLAGEDPDEENDSDLPELVDDWFLVPVQHDDRKLCRQIRQAAQLLQDPVRSITEYTILPTTDCNARTVTSLDFSARMR